MKTKRWICLFLALFFIGIAGFMAFNYYVDPLDYFAVRKGEKTSDANTYTRASKMEYVLKHKDEIEAVTMGGSKSGALSTELLTEYTGKNYYNFFYNAGNFSDYLKFIRFLAENTDISEVTLHLSSFEVDYFTREDTDNPYYQIPAVMTGSKWEILLENLNYLMTDIKTTLEAFQKGDSGKNFYDLATGEKLWTSAAKKMAKDPEGYAEKYVEEDYEAHLKRLFDQRAADYPAFDQNIEAMKEIKEVCDEHGITLKVVIGASFLGERDSYECYRYYSYLRELVSITDVWDFSGFNEINQNPYNFYDRKHYTDAVADLIVNTMYGGESRDGFGVYLTKDTIDDYLDERIADFRALEEEFEQTGTVELFGMEDGSYIAG